MTPYAKRRKEVSEKSLELNLCAEMLQYMRAWRGCERALWFGLTQRQERKAGIDEFIRNVGPGYSLMLQFKAPWPSYKWDYLYKFSINESQHKALEDLAGRYPEAVYYVFPLYSKWCKAFRHAPVLAQDTWIVPVSCMPLTLLTSQSSPASGRHRVDLERVNSRILVRVDSKIIACEAINAREYFSERAGRLSLSNRPLGIPSELLREWVYTWDRENLSLRFRSLNALYTPQP